MRAFLDGSMARRFSPIVCVILWLSAPTQGETSPRTGETRQPRNIYELLYSIDHTFASLLKSHELAKIRTQSPQEIRRTDPELYERVSQDVRAWTDLWVRYVRTSLVPVSEKKLNTAQRKAEQVDAILRDHFKAKGWPYKTLRAIFLPPQVFLDERHREMLTSGMFIPYYPDAFFVSVDWPVPMELVLVHESLHFNKLGTPYGEPMTEGITETGARYLVLKYELLTPYAVRMQESTYSRERKVIDLILDEIMQRKARSRDEATEAFLEAYLTGNQDGMNAVFGAETWTKVLELSKSPGGWQTHRIREVIGK